MTVSRTWRRWQDGDHAGCSMEIKLDEEPYHIIQIITFDVNCVKSYLCASMLDTPTVAK